MRVAVIGGGIAGLSVAYFLAKSGVSVTVFERKYLLYGASGRNSGGLTVQFGDRTLVELAQRSLAFYDELQSEIGFNFLLRKDGYIKLFGSFEDAKRELKIQRSAGVKLIDADRVSELVPGINTDAFACATFYSEGGVIFPWPVIWGLAKGCRELEVEIQRCEAVIAEGGVKIDSEFRSFDFVVNAAGAWSNEVSRQAGIELGNRVVREEICVTESVKPFINPYILDTSSGLFLSQSARGEVVGGIVGGEGFGLDVSPDFLYRYARLATHLLPRLKVLSVLRQWAGMYDVGKDGKPVVKLENEWFAQLNGFGRAGMSIAPAAAEELARMLLGKRAKIL